MTKKQTQKTVTARMNGRSVVLALTGFVELGKEYTVQEVIGARNERFLVITENVAPEVNSEDFDEINPLNENKSN